MVTELSLGRAKLLVKEEHLAAGLIQGKADDFPPVFATMHMIGLMEIAASRAMHPLLQSGELSVGVHVDVGHSAPTALGDTVHAEAEFVGMEGKIFVFKVSARDSGGEIGSGLHKRAIVTKERLVKGAEKRLNK